MLNALFGFTMIVQQFIHPSKNELYLYSTKPSDHSQKLALIDWSVFAFDIRMSITRTERSMEDQTVNFQRYVNIYITVQNCG